MPIAGSSTYALVIVSLGILGVIVSFLIADRKKYFIALGLSLLVVAMGGLQFISSSLTEWRTKRRIARLQEQQRVNLDQLQQRLREAQEKARKPAAASNPAVTVPVPDQAPAASNPPAKKRR